MKQILGYVVIFVAVCSGFYLVSRSTFDDLNFNVLTLSDLWNKDITRLNSAHLLPNGLKDLREIEWVTPNTESKVWAKYVSAPFKLKPNGEYRLELLVLSQTDDDQLIAVIQHHLIHIPTGNSVWELGRTYNLASP